MSSTMRKKSLIKTSYQKLYAAVRTERVTALIAALANTQRKHGVMVACELSEKAHKIFHKETEIRRYESLAERVVRYKRQKQLSYPHTHTYNFHAVK